MAKRRGRLEDLVDRLLARGGSFSSSDLAELSGTTRQAVHRHLRALVRAGRLVREGRGRATRYRRPEPAGFRRRYRASGLAEDQVWSEALGGVQELERAPPNVRAILAYGFTEIVNNAIEHSGASEVEVRLECDGARARFLVADEGVGAFENARAKLGLPDTLSAVQAISKGKVTTDPERHTGEGLFFTSKLADLFDLEANGLRWIVDNLRGDQALGSAAERPGTVVRFEVSLDTERTPEAVFARFTHDFEFDTTRAVVKLFEHGVRFVSRSEAKRLTAGLEGFREVFLDFTGVEAVGQGFADEVFRVWARAHPEVHMVPENMDRPVAFMVERARRARVGGDDTSTG